MQAPTPPRYTDIASFVDKLLPLVPLDIQKLNTDELIATYYDQVAHVLPVSQILALLTSTLGLAPTQLDSVVVGSYLTGWLASSKTDTSSLAATLYTVAQRLQVGGMRES
jgi:hypothetical protein